MPSGIPSLRRITSIIVSRQSGQAQWVDKIERTPIHIPIRRELPCLQPDRITLDIPPGPRIIIPEDVVSEPGFLVEVLAGETQVEDEGAAAGGLVRRGGAERVCAAPVPHRRGVLVGHPARGVEVVGVDHVGLAIPDYRDRGGAEVDVFAAVAAAGVVLSDQPARGLEINGV